MQLRGAYGPPLHMRIGGDRVHAQDMFDKFEIGPIVIVLLKATSRKYNARVLVSSVFPSRESKVRFLSMRRPVWHVFSGMRQIKACPWQAARQKEKPLPKRSGSGNKAQLAYWTRAASRCIVTFGRWAKVALTFCAHPSASR